MTNVISVELKRECEAVQIPAGITATLPAGTPVDITQTLGGSYTVHAAGRLYRIAPKDADALGYDPAAAPVAPTQSGGEAADEAQIWEALKSCYDPEIPVNIVDLGLVYDMHMEPADDGRTNVYVKMTLTAQGCGMGSVIAGDAQQKILHLPGVKDATVDIVWDPPWHHSMISETGRKILGLE